MADPRLDPVQECDRILDLLRKSLDLETKRCVALIHAEAIDEQAKQVGDGMLEDTIETIKERARLRDERLACLGEARRHEKGIMAIKWELAQAAGEEVA